MTAVPKATISAAPRMVWDVMYRMVMTVLAPSAVACWTIRSGISSVVVINMAITHLSHSLVLLVDGVGNERWEEGGSGDNYPDDTAGGMPREDMQPEDTDGGKLQADRELVNEEPEDKELEDTKPGDMVEVDSIHLVHHPWGGPFEQ